MAGKAGRLSRAVAALSIALVAATPANAARFAIACKGKSTNGFLRAGTAPLLDAPMSFNGFTYVIDDEARTLDQYVTTKRKLSPVCAFEGMTCTSAFSTDRVTVNGTGMDRGYRTTITFDWDRKTSRAEMTLAVTGANGAGMITQWSMKCAPAAMPLVGE